jgi:protein TonB
MQMAMKVPQSRIAPAILVSIGLSFSFFWLLYSVTRGHNSGADKSETLPTIDFVRLKRDTEVETLQRRKPPPPPPPKEPPPPAKMKVAADTVQQAASPTPFAMPNLGLSPSVGGGPIIGQIGGGGGVANRGFFDGDIIPLQRINPIYPRDARRAGINGYVVLEFTVNPDGSVRGVKTIESKPKGLFEAAAATAALKWVFKPKMQNGVPVEQKGQQRIEFNLKEAE